ncbi:DNA-binding protein [Diaphorobacter sp.]|uniref:DNA-binding protein n=1 Tax=Diaphorobacter sp. TaxID=1934310 RepID=UPI0028AD29B8|nr:DNA-binding protein [Diaphorobacter sp.]
MQLKSVRGPRGVQMEDVFAAADAVLQQGERPTIERIRHHLGRGSPNTVGPMLDTWYGSLAKRLRAPGESPIADAMALDEQGESGGALPASVLRAAKTMWGRAVQSAREVAESGIAEEKQALQTKAEALAAQQIQLDEERQRFTDRAAALEAAIEAKDQQILQSVRQLEELRHLLSARESEAELLRTDLSKQRIAMDAMRQFTQAKDDEHRKERERLEQRAMTQERRLLTDIDRARQSAKHAEAQLATAQKQSAAQQEDANARIQTLEAQIATQEESHAAMSKDLQEVRAQLDGHKAREKTHAASTIDPLRSTRLRAKPPAPVKRKRLKRI